MNRRAITLFLVLAGLVGGVQALEKDHLAALGEALIGMEKAIAADTRYTRLTQVGSPGCLWTKVDVVNTYDPCEGPYYDASGYGVGPVVPAQTYYYPEPTASYTGYTTDTGSWEGYALPNYGVPTTPYARAVGGVLDQYNYESYGPSYGVGQSASGVTYGTAYGQIVAPLTGVSVNPYGTYYTGSSISYATPYYQDTWYTQAFPGVGQALVPLIPPQYQPVGYGTTGFSIVAAQPYPTGYYAPQYNPEPPSAAPTCSIALSPSDIRYGGSSVISWTSRDATSASLNDFGAVPLSGSKTISNQTASRTFGLTVSRGGRIGACYAFLEVAPEGLARPNCIISVYPDRIQRGQSASIAWLANNATSASLSGYGSVAREGGRTISPTQTTTYTLTVGDGSRTSSCAATLQVL